MSGLFSAMCKKMGLGFPPTQLSAQNNNICLSIYLIQSIGDHRTFVCPGLPPPLTTLAQWASPAFTVRLPGLLLQPHSLCSPSQSPLLALSLVQALLFSVTGQDFKYQLCADSSPVSIFSSVLPLSCTLTHPTACVVSPRGCLAGI